MKEKKVFLTKGKVRGKSRKKTKYNKNFTNLHYKLKYVIIVNGDG